MKKLSRWAEEMMDKKIPEGDPPPGIYTANVVMCCINVVEPISFSK